MALRAGLVGTALWILVSGGSLSADEQEFRGSLETVSDDTLARFDVAIAEFHADMSVQNYTAIWDRSDVVLQRYISREEFVAFLAKAEPMGAFREGRRLKETIQPFGRSTYAHFDMKTVWENGEALESFSFRDKDGEIKLQFWGIDSTVLRPSGEKPSMPGGTPQN